MKIITRQTLANEAPAKFEKEYGHKRGTPFWKGSKTRGEIIDHLNSLPSPVNPDQVDEIIGNFSWTYVPACDDCGKQDLTLVIQLGEEPDYESNTANLCCDCLRTALNLSALSV